MLASRSGARGSSLGRKRLVMESLEQRCMMSANTAGGGPFQFEPLPASFAPTTPGGNPEQPFLLPEGYIQTIIAREGDGGTRDLWDMNTLNETGPQAGRFLYRTHETSAAGQVSVTDLETGLTRVLAERPDWERFDGIAWTPWGTILAAEETDIALIRDPAVPQAVAGLVYEIDPATGVAIPRPAIGSRSHEGLRFDPQGNLYGITETSREDNSPFQDGPGGFIYKFVPDRRGDLSSGQLYALKIVEDQGDRTGEAVWVPLDRATVQVDSDIAAAAVAATGYDRPEDVEIATSTGNNRGGANVMYVAITGEDRVLGIDLREPRGGRNHDTAFVYDYVRDGLNAPADFDDPDNLALDKNGNLYITEDPGGSSPKPGDDIWVAEPGRGGQHNAASRTVRFASLTDGNAEPTGIYFDKSGTILFVNVQHRGGDGRDLAVAITRADRGGKGRYFFERSNTVPADVLQAEPANRQTAKTTRGNRDDSPSPHSVALMDMGQFETADYVPSELPISLRQSWKVKSSSELFFESLGNPGS